MLKAAVRQYRQQMPPEQYFRDGKQYFALDGGTAKTASWPGAFAVGAIVGALFAVADGAAGVFVGAAGAAAVRDGESSGHAGATVRMVWLAQHLKVGTREDLE